MKAAPSCTKCSTPLSAEFLNTETYQICPNCDSPVRIEIFPAFFRELAKGSSGDALVIDTEASCFFHPQKKAAVVCSSCGRYLCALCDLELEGAHYCSGCLESAKEKGKIATIENKRSLYDSMAFHLALVGVPLSFVGLSLISAPVSMYLAIKHWRTPSSIVRTSSHWRQVIAIVLSGLQLLTMLGFIAYFAVK